MSVQRWMGHFVDMGDVILSRRVMKGMVAGKRSVGTSRMRWKYNVMKDVEKLNSLEELTDDRRTYRHLVSGYGYT